MKPRNGDAPHPPAVPPAAAPEGRYARARQEDRVRQGEPTEWLRGRKAAIKRSRIAASLVGPLYRGAKTRSSAFLRWLIRIPILGRLVWWLQTTVNAPRVISDVLDRLAAAQDEIAGLQARVAAHDTRLDDQAAILDAVKLDVKDLKGETPLVESVYEAFEAEFRGDQQVVRQRAEIYLPIITSVSAGAPGFPVLDIGCGRGEWLGLLNDHGLSAKGIDFSRTFVEQVRAQGLEAEQAEAVYYLTRAADQSVGAVTAFHIVEHLGLNSLLALIREARRVIRHGGVLILETPNPENVVVGSCSFYNDPTHLRPIPPPTLAFYLRRSGFSQVTVAGLARLNLVDGPFSDALMPIVERFNMGQDYAAIGYRL